MRGLAARSAKRDTATSPASAALLEPLGAPDASMPPGPTVLLLNDCRDQINLGVNALVDGLIELLVHNLPNPRILPIPSHWLLDTSSGLDAFIDGGRGLRPPRATFPAVADEFDALADDWMDGRGGRDADEYLSRLVEADLVVLNGEGSIYRTNQSAIRELFLAWLAKDRLGTPTIFVNGTVHLTDVVPVLPAMVRKTFPRLDAVAVREPWSLRNLQAHAPEVDAQVLPDSAFVLSPAAARVTPSVAAIRRRIGSAPYFCFDPGPMPMDSRSRNSAVSRLIGALTRVTSRAVLVNSPWTDPYVPRIAEEVGAVYVDTIADYREYMALVADAQFVVSGRYHNTILAAIMGCPAITFASASHKVHGACEMLSGLVGSPYDGTHLVPQLEAIQHHARHYVEHRHELKRKLEEVCARRRLEVQGLGRLAADALGGSASQPPAPSLRRSRP
jgi:polysaccharide pyruvyl transferase WcaK-like protein